MTVTPSFPGVTGLATTTDARKAISGLIVKSAAGVPRSGVFPRHTGALVSARGDMNLDIGIFEAAAVQFGGTILLTNDAVAQLPSVLVSPGAGNNFYVIYAKQNESTAPGTDANNNRVLGAQLSTTSVAAARAALPTGAVELATVQMPTGKTATNQAGVTITATHQYTATEAGGPLLLRDATEQAAWTPHDLSLAGRIDTGQIMQYLATADTPGWYQFGGRPTLTTPTLTTIYSSSGASPARVVTSGGRVYLEGVVVSSSATFVQGTTYTIGSIPAALAPDESQTFACSSNSTAIGAVTVASDGTLSLIQNAGFTGPLALSLAGASWRHKSI